MIVKIQRSAFTTEPSGDIVLIYNKDRSLFEQFDTTPELRRLVKRGEKGYFHAKIVKGVLEVGDDAPWQDW